MIVVFFLFVCVLDKKSEYLYQHLSFKKNSLKSKPSSLNACFMFVPRKALEENVCNWVVYGVQPCLSHKVYPHGFLKAHAISA